MFVPAPELRRVSAPAERIVAIIESINAPNVVLPGADAEPTQAFIVGVRNPDASFSVLIYLYQKLSHRPAIYVSEPRAVPLAAYPEVEADAIQFVESMGFMVDNINFRRQTPAQQAEVMARLPVFQDDPGAQARAQAQASLGDRRGPGDLDGLEELEELPVVGAALPAEGFGAPVTTDAMAAALDSLLPGSLPEKDRLRLARLLAAF